MASQIVIVGNGISGVTCARHIRKNDDMAKIVIVSGETEHFFLEQPLCIFIWGI